MRVFISHDFADSDKFDDLLQALTIEQIDCFRPKQLMVGQGLSEQLRDELERCDVCIFVGTHNSINSSWCGAELGAAWGLKRPVLIYLADSDLHPENMPGQFRSLLMHRSMFKLVRDVVKMSQQAKAEERDEQSGEPGPNLIEEIREVVRAELRGERERAWAYELYVDLRGAVTGDGPRVASTSLKDLLRGFLGQDLRFLPKPHTAGWPHAFSVPTTTGTWDGCALSETVTAHRSLWIYQKCVLLHCGDDGKVDGAAYAPKVLEEESVGMLGLSPWTDSSTVEVGKVELGQALVRR